MPRRFDPRAGSFGTQVVDFDAPLGSRSSTNSPTASGWRRRDPNAARSPVRQPDRLSTSTAAAPEPIRTALREGVAWWRDAFDAAGLVDAFRAEILPEGADPLDIRYNVVNWVNRATRGWSYGQPIVDPRTGEIIKGQVLLGSLRVRQDMMIYQALVGAGLTGTGDPNDPITAALARIRQLGAHEVGHALGFAHNFAASIGGRNSVMDYPAPRVRLVDGKPDLTDAYGVGVGRWDRFVVDWLYGARTDADGAAGDGRGAAAGPALRRRPGRTRAGLPLTRSAACGTTAPIRSPSSKRVMDGPRRPRSRASGRPRSAPAIRKISSAARSCRSGCCTAIRSRRPRSCSAASTSPMR